MGRIDDALRRARAPLPDVTARQPGHDVFVSVWPELDAPAPAERPLVRTPPSKRSAAIERTAPAPPPVAVTPALAAPPTLPRPVAVSRASNFAAEWREKIALTATNDAIIHQFRRLAAILVQTQRSRRVKTVMVTSALPGDGKTLTALNLALVLSESYRRRVVLVEADFRRPRISSVVNLPVGEGLTDVMNAVEDRKVPRVQLTSHLTLLPAGRPD